MASAFGIATGIVESVGEGALGKLGETIAQALIGLVSGEGNELEQIVDKLNEIEQNEQILQAGLRDLKATVDLDTLGDDLTKAYTEIDGFRDQLRQIAINITPGNDSAGELGDFYREATAGSAIPAALELIHGAVVGKTRTALGLGYIDTIWTEKLGNTDTDDSMRSILQACRSAFAEALHYQQLGLALLVATERQQGHTVDDLVATVGQRITAQCNHLNAQVPQFLHVLAVVPESGVPIEKLLWQGKQVCYYDVEEGRHGNDGERGLGIVEDVFQDDEWFTPERATDLHVGSTQSGQVHHIWPSSKGSGQGFFQYWVKRGVLRKPAWVLGWSDRDRPTGEQSQGWLIRQSIGATGEMTIRNSSKSPWTFESRLGIVRMPKTDGSGTWSGEMWHSAGIVRDDATDDDAVRFTFNFSADVVAGLQPAFPKP